MNDYTRASRDFTAGHIAVVAKLDITRTPYKYVIYEKEFGAFGLVDDESLELVMQTITNFYRGMNYSKAKVIKYAEATDKTYELLNSLKPLQSVASITSTSRFVGAVFNSNKKEVVGSNDEASTLKPHAKI